VAARLTSTYVVATGDGGRSKMIRTPATRTSEAGTVHRNATIRTTDAQENDEPISSRRQAGLAASAVVGVLVVVVEEVDAT